MQVDSQKPRLTCFRASFLALWTISFLTLSSGTGTSTSAAVRTCETEGLDPSKYQSVAVNGLNFNVYIDGDASLPTVLLIHGIPASSSLFKKNVPAFRAAGFRLIIPDLLGHGDSDKPTNISLYTGPKDYEHVLGIMNALNVDRFDIVCGDRGSIPGWSIAALNPNRVRRLVSINLSHLNGFFSAGIDQMRRSWYMYYLQFDAAEQMLRADNWSFFRAFVEHNPDADEWIEDLSKPGGLQGGVLNWYRANRNPDDPPANAPLPNVTVPVLITYSDNDPYIGLEQLAVGNQYIKGPLKIVRIEGAGHFVESTAPHEFNRIVIDYLTTDTVDS